MARFPYTCSLKINCRRRRGWTKRRSQYFDLGLQLLAVRSKRLRQLVAGEAAHRAIPGSTWTAMPGVGHFPMSENPEAFLVYLLPVLEQIRQQPASA